MSATNDPTWTTIGHVTSGNQIIFTGGFPAQRNYNPQTATRRQVTHVEHDGRTVIITFDGGTFDAGHAYRLWVLR